MLARVKKAYSREEYENRNRGRFIRIFPSDDKTKQERYIHLLEAAYSTFMSGRATSMHKEIQLIYNNKLKVNLYNHDMILTLAQSFKPVYFTDGLFLIHGLWIDFYTMHLQKDTSYPFQNWLNHKVLFEITYYIVLVTWWYHFTMMVKSVYLLSYTLGSLIQNGKMSFEYKLLTFQCVHSEILGYFH